MPITIKRKGLITDRYSVFIDIVSAFHGIKLSAMEKKILNGFFWINSGKVNTMSRKELAESLSITSYNLNNQILKLRRKKFILPDSKNKEEDCIIKELLPDIEADKKSFFVQLELIS